MMKFAPSIFSAVLLTVLYVRSVDAASMEFQCASDSWIEKRPVGTCKIFSCDQSRGITKCAWPFLNCECKDGYCANPDDDFQSCVKVEPPEELPDEVGSPGHCITAQDLIVRATCDWHIWGCPPGTECIHHGTFNNVCQCKAGTHVNVTFRDAITASKLGSYKADWDAWKLYACVPNPHDACLSENDTDSGTWCNYGVFGCQDNLTHCDHLGFFDNKCDCKPGYHIDLSTVRPNEHNALDRQVGWKCVADANYVILDVIDNNPSFTVVVLTSLVAVAVFAGRLVSRGNRDNSRYTQIP